ncbi:MAG: hypothetical protein K5905_24590 [Roseibium sp.]|uniref:hypothetical protein n=1 Tax=Roseibium sp. TaxID=1936156 RepID=UPI00260E88BF|nr:hypothetical protein [Roseibium sp.]MCV0428648.1 hypothetical protein [Roseibium sp.]
MSKDFLSSQEQLSATLDRHLKESETQLFQLKSSLEQNARLAEKNRWLKLSAAVLISATLTLCAVLFLDNQLRWALVTSAFNQTTYTDYPVLVFDTQSGTYKRCQDTATSFICQLTE